MPLLMHEMTTEHVHEEIQLLANDFSSMLMETLGHVPRWRDYYESLKRMEAYLIHVPRSLSEYLWIKIFYAASSVAVVSSGRSTSLPFSNFAPARTSATRWGALTARQRGLGGVDELVAPWQFRRRGSPGPW